MSKKVLNLLTVLNILFGTICIFYFIKNAIYLLDTTITKENYTIYNYSSILIILPIMFALILGYIRSKRSFEGKFILNKGDIIFFITIFLTFLIFVIILYFLPIISIDYCILKLEAFKAFPKAKLITYFIGIIFEIYFIFEHFFPW